MNPLALALLIAVIAVIALGVVCYASVRARNEAQIALVKAETALDKTSEEMSARDARTAELRQELIEARNRIEELRSGLNDAERRASVLDAQMKRDAENRAANQTLLFDQFKNLANEILEDKSRRFTETNKVNIENTLGPLKERITAFEKKVDETYDKETLQRLSLQTEIKNLRELNVRISTEANNLTSALKGQAKTRGTWGEVILERVLEMSGLEKGREYELQASLQDSEGRRFQPDVVINLPEDRHLVIDSKVNLNAYERYCSLEDGPERDIALKSHCVALERHCAELNQKRYQELYGLNSLDFVLLFVPIEGAFSLAAQHGSKFFDEAFSRNIVVVCPSTLLATMRTIGHIWRQEKQNRNVRQIVDKAGALYDKFVGFVADMNDLGKRLGDAQKSFDGAFNKLQDGKGNLISRAENIRKLGAKNSKQLPAHLIDDDSSDESSETASLSQIS